jgi:3alpha(or 20beta)-hydroxysteroid dehydrogenase
MTDDAWRNVSLEGKTALVTGAARGQGAAHARLFAARGARVVLTDVLEPEGKATAAEIGDAARFVRHDVTDPDGWEAAVAAAVADFGGLDILVNNAAICEFRTLEEETLDGFERLVRINLTGTFLGIKAVTPSLRRNGGGVIVNIASTMANVGTSLYAPYVASKWALRGLTRTAALELGRDGIRVNSIHPGVISTPLINEPIAGQPPIADFYSPEPYAIPRMGNPADITALLLYVTSADASFVTGSEFVADGGLLLGPALQPDTTAA